MMFRSFEGFTGFLVYRAGSSIILSFLASAGDTWATLMVFGASRDSVWKVSSVALSDAGGKENLNGTLK